MEKRNVVVIGAGNTGIFTAAALAQAGMKPLLLEAHNLPGGCATSFVRGRFEFDVSLHGMDGDSIGGMMNRDLKLHTEFPRYPKQTEFVTVQNGEIHRDFYDHSRNVAKQVEQNYPGQGKAYKDTVKKIVEIKKAFLELTDNPESESGKKRSGVGQIGKMIKTLARHPEFLKNGLKHTSDFYDKYKVPEYVRSLLSVYWWYVGARLTDVPEFLSCMVTDFDEPHTYVKDTAHSYLAETEKLIRAYGGDVYYNTAATKINVRDKKVVSVETSQGDVIETNYVVSAIDPRITVGRLLAGDTSFKENIMKEEQEIKENFSFFMIYLGLDCTAKELGLKVPHAVINEVLDPVELWDNMSNLHGPKTIGVMCPNLFVDQVSPEGTCIVSLSVPIQGSVLEGLSQKEYVKLKNEFAERIIKKTEEYLDIELMSHIEEIEIAAPETFARYAGMYNGGLGNYLSTKQTLKVRSLTGKMNKEMKGLSFTGQFAGNLGYANTVAGYQLGKELAGKMKAGE